MNMALFRCLIVGENFPGVLIGQEDDIGFYATRFVEATSAKEAEMAALELLRHDKSLDVPANARSPQARVYFEEIDEMPLETERVPNEGFTFFRMGT
jgi:hypothetical protein